MNNILIIDTCYTVFFRFNAAKKWFSFSESEDYNSLVDNDSWLSNNKFKDKYELMFSKGIEKHIKKYNITDILWVQDDSTENVWRTKIFPEYKQGRDESKCKSENVFSYTFNTFLPKYFKENKLKNIKVSGAEADDIIAITTKYLTKKKYNCIVVTSDTDFIQLINDNVTLVDLKLKEIESKISPKVDLELKIIKGDKSDNIPSIKNRIGEKTALNYINNKPLFEKLLEDNNINEQYKKNRLLIDFDYIPKELENKILKKLEKIF